MDIPEYISPHSDFIRKDTRTKRWAVPYHHKALNARAHILLGQHRDLLSGNTILDLGSHFGTFAYIALQLGAAQVTCVDTDESLIKQGHRLFKKHHVSESQYQFVCQNVIDYLYQQPDQSVDIVFCLGLLYYLPDQYHVLSHIRRVARKIIFIDTFTAYYYAIIGKDSWRVRERIKEDTFHIPMLMQTLTQAKKKDYYIPPTHFRGDRSLNFLTCPTIPLLDLYFSSLNCTVEKLDWSPVLKNPDKNWKELITPKGKTDSHWTDIYSTEIRVSYILHC